MSSPVTTLNTVISGDNGIQLKPIPVTSGNAVIVMEDWGPTVDSTVTSVNADVDVYVRDHMGTSPVILGSLSCYSYGSCNPPPVTSKLSGDDGDDG